MKREQLTRYVFAPLSVATLTVLGGMCSPASIALADPTFTLGIGSVAGGFKLAPGDRSRVMFTHNRLEAESSRNAICLTHYLNAPTQGCMLLISASKAHLPVPTKAQSFYEYHQGVVHGLLQHN